MTPLQAEMLSSTLAMIASIVADEFLPDDQADRQIYQRNVASECRKAFLSQLTSFHLITPEPKPKQRRGGANERKTPVDS